MVERPRVSCVIIFLDTEKYLDESIRSVLAQSYSDWELLLVDDGSTDASSAIARGYARDHPGRVRYLEHPGHSNRGMSASRNLGVAHSRGEYIALLDADDIWLPEKLAVQVAALEAHPEAAMVYDATKLWHTWTGDPAAAGREKLRTLGVPEGTLVQPPEMVTRFLRNTAETPGTCSVLMRKEAILRIGGFVNSFRGMFEDQAFFYKMCLESPVLVSGGATALYRQHPESHCHVSVEDGTYLPSGESATLGVFLDWLADYTRPRLDSSTSPARLMPDDIKVYLKGRRSRRDRMIRPIRRAAGRFARRVLRIRQGGIP